MTDYVYAVINKEGIVENIISADNPDASIPLKLLIPDAENIVLSNEETGPAYIGGDLFNGQLRPPKTMDSWVWSIENKKWQPPIEYPQDGNAYYWDEDSISWIKFPSDGED